MKCAQIKKLLPLYLENELSQKKKTAVEAHLKICLGCATELDNLKKVSLILTSMPELEIRPELQARLYSLPAQLALAPRRKIRLLEFFLMPSAQPIMAAACIFLVFISFFIFHPDGRYLGHSLKEKVSLSLAQFERTVARVEGLPGYLPLVRKSIVDSLKNIVQTRAEESEKI